MKTKSLLPLLLLLTPAVLASPQDVALDLRAGQLDPAQAAARWAEAGVTPQQALELIRQLPHDAGPAEDHSTTLRDRFGRETSLEVRMPESPAPDGSYRVMVALHGMGANTKQPVSFGPALAPPHTILVVPQAQRIPKGVHAEDLRRLDTSRIGLGNRLNHWWSYREGSFPLLALDYLRARYPIDPDRVYLVGFSMGGFGAWNVGLRFHDRFAAVVPISGGISRLEYLPIRDRRSRSLLDNARMQPTLIVHGTADRTVPSRMSSRSAEELQARDCDVTFFRLPGASHYPFKQLHEQHPGEIREWLEAHVRDPHPARVDHTVLGSYHGGAYWMRVDATSSGSASVHAQIVSRDAITVTTEAVSRLTVYLDPAQLDVSGPVSVSIDGGLVHAGVVAPSLQAVAESYARALDPALTYAHALTVELPSGKAPRVVK